MAEAQKSLEFLLTTKAELSGAKQLEDQLQRDIGKAKALGNVDEIAKLTTQLTTVRSALKDTEVEENALAEAGEALHHNHRQLHELLHEMGHESVPVLGQALGGMLRGPLGPALALTAVIGYLKTAFEEWQTNLENAGEAAAHSQFSESLKKMGEDMDDARDKANAYALTIADIAKNEISIAQALASQLQLIHAVSAARAEAAKAAEDLDKATIKRKADAGEITPEQATLHETAAAIQALKDEAAARKKTQEDETAAKQAALDKASLAQPDLDAAAHAAGVEAEKRKSHADRLAGNFGPDGKVDFTTVSPSGNFGIPGADNVKTETGVDIKDALRKAQADVDEWQVKVEEAEKALEQEKRAAALHLGQPNDVVGKTSDLEKTLAYFGQAVGQLHRFQEGVNQYQKNTSPDAKTELQKLQHDAEEADKKGRANAEEISKLRSELMDVRAQNDRTQPINDVALADRIATVLQGAVDKLYSQPRGSEVETGVQISDRVERGGSVSDSQKDFLMALDAALGGHAQTLKEAADHIAKFKDDTSAFFNAVLTLTNNAFTAQQRQLDALATTVSRITNHTNNP